jgi:hypothetical protein
LLETFGWTAVAVGIPIAAASSDSGGQTAGIVTAVLGAAMIVGGVLYYDPGSNRNDEYTYVPSATSYSDYPPR